MVFCSIYPIVNFTVLLILWIESTTRAKKRVERVLLFLARTQNMTTIVNSVWIEVAPATRQILVFFNNLFFLLNMNGEDLAIGAFSCELPSKKKEEALVVTCTFVWLLPGHL